MAVLDGVTFATRELKHLRGGGASKRGAMEAAARIFDVLGRSIQLASRPGERFFLIDGEPVWRQWWEGDELKERWLVDIERFEGRGVRP